MKSADDRKAFKDLDAINLMTKYKTEGTKEPTSTQEDKDRETYFRFFREAVWYGATITEKDLGLK